MLWWGGRVPKVRRWGWCYRLLSTELDQVLVLKWRWKWCDIYPVIGAFMRSLKIFPTDRYPCIWAHRMRRDSRFDGSRIVLTTRGCFFKQKTFHIWRMSTWWKCCQKRSPTILWTENMVVFCGLDFEVLWGQARTDVQSICTWFIQSVQSVHDW